jgi:hypothetical protein
VRGKNDVRQLSYVATCQGEASGQILCPDVQAHLFCRRVKISGRFASQKMASRHMSLASARRAEARSVVCASRRVLQPYQNCAKTAATVPEQLAHEVLRCACFPLEPLQL